MFEFYTILTDRQDKSALFRSLHRENKKHIVSVEANKG